MGLIEVLRHLPDLLRVRRAAAAHFLAQPPDVFIGIDSPDFNLGLARRLKRHGIPTCITSARRCGRGVQGASAPSRAP